MTFKMTHPALLIQVGFCIGAVIGLLLLAWFLTFAPFSSILLLLAALLCIPLLLQRPWLVWLAIAAALPFTSGIKVGILSATDGLVGVATALWFIDGVRRRSLRLEASPIVTAALTYALLLYTLSLQAKDVAEALPEVLKWVEFALVILLVRAMLPAQQCRWLVAALLAGGMGQALYGFYQFIFRIGPEWFMVGPFMRAYGSFSQPNPYAGYIGLTLPVALSFLIWEVGGTLRKWINRNWRLETGDWLQSITRNLRSLSWISFYTYATVLLVLAMLASWSRGGWIGMAGSSIVVMTRQGRKPGWLVFMIILLLAIFLLVGQVLPSLIPAPILDRLSALPAYIGLTNILDQPLTEENFAVMERVAHWAAAIRMWMTAPWLGVGPGNYAVVYPRVKISGWDEALGHAHNIYLNVLAETGILGFCAFVIFGIILLSWLERHLQSAKQAQQSWNVALIIGVLGVMAHLFIHNIFDNLFVQGMYLHLGLWLAAIYVLEE